MSPKHWKSLLKGKFKHEQRIEILEGRAQLLLLEVLAKVKEFHHTRVLSLLDNASCHGAFSKGRSPSWDLNNLCRRRFSLSLATGMSFLTALVGTHYQPMDADSREVQ